MKNFKRHTITAALPYANGPLHIGHIAGAYLPADTYVRYLRLKGEDVVFICGSDEHGVAITLGAKKEGVTPKAFVDKYHSLMKKAFGDFGISFDIYSRTSNPVHYETAQEFFKNIYDKGIFLEETSDQYYDEQEGIFLADRYIIGTCPKCGNPNAYGDQCEKCGTSLSPRELINPRSTVSGKTPVLKPTKHWYFPLDKYESWLKEWIVEGHKDDWKTNVYGQCKSWIDQGLQPRSITRDLDWGVPVPLKDGKGKVLYVWFDAPIGYISATKELKPNDWKKYWQDPESRLIHFIGKDNIVFHCVIFPSILKAAGGYVLPDNVPANEFLNLEGDKISTSRNHAVWLHEYLQDFPGRRDELRYMLTSISPETKDADFTWKDYQSKVNSELVAILGNFVNRVMVLTWKYFDGKVPSAHELPATDDRRKKILNKYNQAHTDLNTSVKDMIAALDDFRFRESQFHMMNLCRIGNKFLADTEPWKLAKDDMEAVGSILNYALTVVGNIAIACEPFLPDTAKNIKSQLNSSAIDASWKEFWKKQQLIDPVPQNHQLGKAELLFKNIEDEEIDKQVAKLKKPKVVEEQKSESAVKPLKAQVTIDDFSKLDIRVGKVLAAEKMEKSDKLLKLTVDTGVDQRTVLSGIAKHYSPEEMVGKQVTLIANLAPRKMMGIESQGMILMAEDADGKLRLLQPNEVVNPGSTVS
ncbi:MAG TPA: methionine--tRNA ligase [Cyclobacteriaceae bacterium]|nr:methionine--tRNA ligase [Cyclobacteriaceae bacterium]HMV08621.1 methionine--tRNA ligase [Cyclobacteriaceae bacterium]HMX00170.1 methionine--tRNA ligase [Cyclobacteriaceae bacterium]HMY92990.1 methionine--tRNA ligase [Cyclobacteriaceae bacterium]HNA10938.1 methionine--tRNA ligase [Cyclobacteriaceae bacterium]